MHAEELIAERFSSAFLLCADLEIPGRLRRSDYIGCWLQLLYHGKKAIFTPAREATEAAKYLHSFSREEASHA